MFELMPFRTRPSRLARSAFGDMSDFLDNFFQPFGAPFGGNFMRSDIKDKGGEYQIEVELPGVKKEDIGVELDRGFLTVSVNTKEEKKEEKENYIVQERRTGACQRSFRLNDSVKKSDIKAEYKDGILVLTVPKTKEEKKEDTRILIS